MVSGCVVVSGFGGFVALGFGGLGFGVSTKPTTQNLNPTGFRV